MKNIFNGYMNDNLKLELWQKIGVICFIISISGFFGWIYEFIFYYFNFGCEKFYWQGGNFLPWINIYAIGSILIILSTIKFKKNPIVVFLIATLSTGILEYISGYLIYVLNDGLRLWDYNTEILNFGNINGFVCLRSVLFFGISGLLLMYIILPFGIYLSTKLSRKVFLTITILVCSIILIDEFYNLLIASTFKLPRARDIYSQLGINYMTYKRG
ncbi:MAG: putative ABC transporter permease [Bacilli bacterium]|nr:putative ABC transporter permease [Bacilli bacterium]